MILRLVPLCVVFVLAGIPRVSGQGCPVGPGNPTNCNGDINGDGTRGLADAIELLNFLFLSGPPPVGFVTGLSDTGQQECYDALGQVIDCDSTEFPNQDGAVESGLGENPDRFVIQAPDPGRPSELVTVDSHSGLMWLHRTGDINSDGLMDSRDRADWAGALVYCDQLEYAGFDDWRLPSIRELLSIVQYNRTNPSIDSVAFGNTVGAPYWTSTSREAGPNTAWTVNFNTGGSQPTGKTGPNYVRAVRGGIQ